MDYALGIAVRQLALTPAGPIPESEQIRLPKL
jgi:hypothetical protein